jgi:hypothetical protein
MSLDLPTLIPQLNAAGQSAAEHIERINQLLPKAEQALQALADLEQPELDLRLERAGLRWPGAIPTSENPVKSIPPTQAPSQYRIVAADGSQIYPDRHAAALYYLINIGSIQIHPGSGSAPTTSSTPELFHSAQDLHDETGSLLGTEYINGQRDVAEMGELAQLAGSGQKQPCLALLDNGLLLWLMLQVRDQQHARAEELLAEYIGHMDRLRQAGAALAGIIDRPRHGNVLALVHLAQLPLDSLNDSTLQANPYRGLSDAAIFSQRLAVGQRSALFHYASPVNDQFRKAGHEILFFYVRTAETVLLRVEIPVWISQDPALLDLVHAGILADSQSSGGFPYSLARAHELAVVSTRERQHLENVLAAALTGQGLTPRSSTKATMKSWLSGRRSHRL